MTSSTVRSDEVILRVSDGIPEALETVRLKDIGYQERKDLQRWVEEHPEVVGSGLLLVTTEFDRWEFGRERVLDRLDLLFLTADGAPLVAELKRGEAPDTVDLQALKYAAYCSQLTVEQIVEAYADRNKIGPDEARADVMEHAPSLVEKELRPVRVRLVAEDFKPSVTTMVMWMHQELGLDIGCVRVTAKRLTDGSAVVLSRLIVPPPAAEEYLVGVRRRNREEERLQESSAARRKPNAVPRLIAAEAIEPGTELKLALETFNPKERKLLGPLLEKNGATGLAEWTGKTANRWLKWRRDGELYSASGLVVKILQLCGARSETDGGSAHGPLHWKVPDGRTLWEFAEALPSVGDEGSP